DFRPDPMCANAWQSLGFGERRIRDLKLVEPSTQVQQQLRVEARADFAGKDEIIPIEVPDKQRAETDTTALWIGESANDKLLRRFAFHLQPVRRTPVFVR